jgi:hypothetical protein
MDFSRGGSNLSTCFLSLPVLLGSTISFDIATGIERRGDLRRRKRKYKVNEMRFLLSDASSHKSRVT